LKKINAFQYTERYPLNILKRFLQSYLIIKQKLNENMITLFEKKKTQLPANQMPKNKLRNKIN
jgi:hypothetical protein